MQLKIKHPSVRDYLDYLPDSIKEKVLEKGAPALSLYWNILEWEAETFSEALFLLLPMDLSPEDYGYWNQVIHTYENSEFDLGLPPRRPANKKKAGNKNTQQIIINDTIFNNNS